MMYPLIDKLLSENNISCIFISALRGCAWFKERKIEIPKPTTPLRLSIGLHEIGHIVLNHNRTKKRYIEEKEAWDYAIKMMRANNIPIKKKVRERRKRAINWAIKKAIKRGLKDSITNKIFDVK